MLDETLQERGRNKEKKKTNPPQTTKKSTVSKNPKTNRTKRVRIVLS
jgi:hypothetical protein